MPDRSPPGAGDLERVRAVQPGQRPGHQLQGLQHLPPVPGREAGRGGLQAAAGRHQRLAGPPPHPAQPGRVPEWRGRAAGPAAAGRPDPRGQAQPDHLPPAQGGHWGGVPARQGPDAGHTVRVHAQGGGAGDPGPDEPGAAGKGRGAGKQCTNGPASPRSGVHAMCRHCPPWGRGGS